MTDDTLIRVDITLKGGQLVSGRLLEGDPTLDSLLLGFAGQAPPGATVAGVLSPDRQGTIFLRYRDILAIEIDRRVQPRPVAANPASHVIIEDVLHPATYDWLLSTVIARPQDFQDATITDTVTGLDVVRQSPRQSRVLYEPPEIKRLFLEKIRDRLPTVAAALGCDPPPAGGRNVR